MTIVTHEPRHCRAHNRYGEPCAAFPIRGAVVCSVHGGRAPQVKKAANERLAEMVDPLLTELFRIAQSGENDAVRLAAVRDALDRAGFKPKERIEQSGKLVIEIAYGDDEGTGPPQTPALSAATDQE